MATLLPHTPPRPSRLRECMVVEDQSVGSHGAIVGQYLGNLRSNRVSRPTGSRPPPPSKLSSLRRAETAADLHATPENGTRPQLPSSNSMPIMPASKPPHQRADSVPTIRSPFLGRPLVRPPSALGSGRATLTPTDEHVVSKRPSMQYVERGTRWMEKQETKSITQAMQEMDLATEQKVHEDARDEAADLVWKHQNPDAPYTNPDAPYANPDVKKDYREHLRRGSYQRSHSQEMVPNVGKRTASGSSTESAASATGSLMAGKRRSMEMLRKISPPTGIVSMKKTRTPSGKSFGGLAEAVADDIAKAHRRTSSGSRRVLSGEKKKFMHPDDKIWEDPEEGTPKKNGLDGAPVIAPPAQPAHIRKNPFARVRMQAEKLERTRSEPVVSHVSPRHNVEIQRNPPSQSRNAGYMSNAPILSTPPGFRDRASEDVSPKSTPKKEGDEVKERRSDDIRSATSKSRGDYSPKLPRPTIVSDKPGRPIVSFKEDWKPKEVRLEEVRSTVLPESRSEPAKRSTPSSPASRSPAKPPSPMTNIPRISIDEAPKPPAPTINLPDDPAPAIPTIVLPEEPDFAASSVPAAPTINIEAPPSSHPPSQRAHETRDPSPTRRPRPRPLPHHAATSPLPKSTPHYTPSPLRPTTTTPSATLCASCALPIAGRILSAGGARFHPACFTCHHCSTNLELVAFYPEPCAPRTERLARIHARHDGLPIPAQFSLSESQLRELEFADGADDGPRFYCHLDYHEAFSPRCKTCKTPIEGEVILACGSSFHAGHFFCAQCGDPFDSLTPFVEKEGYAWCVGCHTNRFSGKCRGCRKPVTETVVKALGGDWHEGCFRCGECEGGFGEEGRFFVRGGEGGVVVCVGCEERRLKA